MLLQVNIDKFLGLGDEIFDENGNKLGYSATIHNTDVKVFDKDGNEICGVALYDTETKTAYFEFIEESREVTATEQDDITIINHGTIPARAEFFEGSYAVVDGKRVE